MEKRYFSGPLNLCREKKRADTVMGTELVLNEKEFDTLDMLVSREGEPVAFEQIYKAVWDDPANADGRDAARAAMWNLIEQVGSAGKGFMRIEYTPEAGYSFRTHWGHNWQTERANDSIIERIDGHWGADAVEHERENERERDQERDQERDRERVREVVDVGAFIISVGRSFGKVRLPYTPPGRDGTVLVALLGGVAVTAAAIVLLFTSMFSDMAYNTRSIEDAQVPLALMSFESTSVCVGAEGCAEAGCCAEADACPDELCCEGVEACAETCGVGGSSGNIGFCVPEY